MRVDVIITLSIDFGKDQSMILEIFGNLVIYRVSVLRTCTIVGTVLMQM
jgi:hypothetical protein